MTIVGDTIAISRKALKTAMVKVKELTVTSRADLGRASRPNLR